MAISQIFKNVRDLNPKSDPTSPWWHLDLIPILAALSLSAIGALGIFSTTKGRDLENPIMDFVERQAMFTIAGLVVMLVIITIDYRKYFALAPVGYLSAITLLVGLIFYGVVRGGAQSWYSIGNAVTIQPSEFTKIAIIVVNAAYLSKAPDGPLPLKFLIRVLAISALPLLLIAEQPDLGTAIIIVVIIAAQLMVARAETHHLVVLVLVTVLAIVVVWPTKLINQFQRNRLTSFLDPTKNPSAAFNQEQAKIAVGNGGVGGTGWGKGVQTATNFVPEQHSDFIFTAIAEEFGFVGSCVLLMCFAILIVRCFRIARLAGDSFGGYLTTGVLAMFAFQMFQSIGMSLGIMPITGIPLPFVSYGGSSTMTSWIGIGLIVNVHMRRFSAGIDAEVQAGI